MTQEILPRPGNAEQRVLSSLGLKKKFGSVTVLDGLDLTVGRGDVYGFLGRNGAGKTTAIRIFMGILSKDDGDLEYFGERVHNPGAAQKRRIGYVSQTQHFYPWMTPLRLGRFLRGFYTSWDEPEFQKLLITFSIPPDRKVAALSQGTQVKLALALALAHHPELLILDEPTAGLDPAGRREFLDIVRRQAEREERTTFFSSHLVDEVERVATRVGIIDSGRLIFEGGLDVLRGSLRTVPCTTLEAWTTTQPLPDGFRVISHDRVNAILRATPTTWSATPSLAVQSSTMSLEDAFLALVVHSDM